MSGKELGVAILGTGWVAGEHIKAYQLNPHTRVVSLLSRSREKAEAAIRKYGLSDCRADTALEDVLARADVEAVSICTPHHLHAPQGIAAAQAGRHILVEKPAALNLSELLALDAAVSAAGVRSVVSFVLRWNPLFANIRAMLDDGLLGELFYAGVDYFSGIGAWYTGYEWMRYRNCGGSNLLSAGCHAVDAARWFVRSRVLEVAAVANTSRSNRLAYEYDTNSITLLKFANGAIGKIGCSIECVMPYQFNILLQGDAGSIRNHEVFTSRWPGQKDWAAVPTITPDTAEVSHHPFAGEVDHFVDCILRGVESHASVRDAVETHRICFASEIAARTGRPVDPWGDLPDSGAGAPA